jgi:hypothetical protein
MIFFAKGDDLLECLLAEAVSRWISRVYDTKCPYIRSLILGLIQGSGQFVLLPDQYIFSMERENLKRPVGGFVKVIRDA